MSMSGQDPTPVNPGAAAAKCASLPEVLLELQRRMPGALTVGVAVDGSDISDKAAATAARFINTKRGDKLTILHISDKTKTFLPKNLEPKHLKRHYEDMAGIRVTTEWVCREKEEGRTTCQTLTTLASRHQVSLLFMGSFGRKGEKLDNLGSVSETSLRESHASICIVRSTGSSMGQANFLFATDGSHAAALAFCMLCTMLMKPTDIVNVVMISTDNASNESLEQATIDHYREFMEAHKVLGRAFVKYIDRSVTRIPDGIVEAAKESDANILVMGISGYGRKKLGSVSQQISTSAHCTTLIIKDSYEILKNRYTTGSRSIAADVYGLS